MRQADIEKIKFNNTNTYLSLSLHPCFPFRLNSIQFQQLPHEQLRKNTKFILRNPSPATHSHFQSTHLKIQNTQKSPQQLTITIKNHNTYTTNNNSLFPQAYQSPSSFRQQLERPSTSPYRFPSPPPHFPALSPLMCPRLPSSPSSPRPPKPKSWSYPSRLPPANSLRPPFRFL